MGNLTFKGTVVFSFNISESKETQNKAGFLKKKESNLILNRRTDSFRLIFCYECTF